MTTTQKEYYVLSRPIGETTLNGLEDAIGPAGEPLRFTTPREVIDYAKAHGATDQDFDNGALVIRKIDAEGNVTIF